MSNLVVLCKKHHQAVHSGHITVKGWEDQISGRVLNWMFNSADGADGANGEKSSKCDKNGKGVSGRKKLDTDTVLWIKRLIVDEKISRKITVKKLYDEKNIKISLGTLGKIINNKY